MARRYDETCLFEAWRALPDSESTKSGWRVIPVSSECGDLFQAGRHFPDKLEAVLVGFRMEPPGSKFQLPQGKGFVVEYAGSLPGQPGTWIALHRQPTGNLEMFARMAVDILNVLGNHAGEQDRVAFDIFLHRIRAWQKFMEQNRSAALSLEEEVGLCGELEMLKDILETGVPPSVAIAAWTGPAGALHDFSFGTGGLEVKSTIAAQGAVVCISSAEQLDTAVVAPLFLAVHRFVRDSSGQSLMDRVLYIRELLKADSQALILYDTLLLHFGIADTCSCESSEKLRHVEGMLFPISADFPRIAASTLHDAIVDVRYAIDLSLAFQDQITLTNALLNMGVVLHGAS